jgi:G2/mitotic-specific cyclin 1/2
MEELDLWGNELSDGVKDKIVEMARCEVFLELDPPLSPSTPCNALNTKVRSILFEWISQVHTGMQMPLAADGVPDPQDMLFRTYRHVDAYIMRRAVQRAELQLAGVACTLLAIGRDNEHHMEDDLELSSWLAFVTDGSCTVPQVRQALREVRKVLGSHLHQPTIYTFLRRFLRRTGWTEESFSLANYLIELAAIDSAFLTYRPQVIAAAAAVLSRQYLAYGINVKQVPSWKAKLLRCAHVDLQSELAPCISALSHLHVAEQSQHNKFVNRKYSWARLHMVAKIPPNAPADAAFFAAYLLE